VFSCDEQTTDLNQGCRCRPAAHDGPVQLTDRGCCPVRERRWTAGISSEASSAFRSNRGRIDDWRDTRPRHTRRHHRRIDRAQFSFPRDFMLARMAALIAVDAPPAPCLANAGPPRTARSPPATSKGVMIAVAPVVRPARVVLAGGRILRPWASRSLWPAHQRRRASIRASRRSRRGSPESTTGLAGGAPLPSSLNEAAWPPARPMGHRSLFMVARAMRQPPGAGCGGGLPISSMRPSATSSRTAITMVTATVGRPQKAKIKAASATAPMRSPCRCA